MDSPREVMVGIYDIIVVPDLLITDYIEVGGIGASFVNSGLLMLLSIFIFYYHKEAINGVSIAALFLMSGFALFGKNLFNILIIILGVYLYAKVQKEKFSKYLYIALFATSMAPFITDFLFSIQKPFGIRLALSLMIGLLLGFLVPPLSAHMVNFHKGFNLYNIGFTTGMIGTIFVSLLKSYGYKTRSSLVWSSGNDLILGCFLGVIFLSFVVIGYFQSGRSFSQVRNIWKSSGKLVCDYVVMEGFGPVLINMGLNGLLGMAYVLLVGGPLNGPTIGGILTMVGFGALGKHVKNMLPIFVGVFIGALTKTWSIDDPSILLAALFGTSLAPIAGKFGWVYGILAGFINSSVVLSVGALHGGLNLYNTGFSSGIVAAVMVPVIEAFKKEEKDKIE